MLSVILMLSSFSLFADVKLPAIFADNMVLQQQSTMMIKVVGSKSTSIIFMADVWKPDTQWDSRYLWMPLQIGSGKLW
ncbi:MAG: hypothetical protein H7098_01800, partial [Oligoflexus sp.]|nr:hypothetical protein [Pseudopedobacter sp.]